MSTLRIWMPDRITAPWFWCLLEGGQRQAVTDTDKAALAGLSAKRVEIILSGQSVRIYPVDIPALKSSERIRAARFHIEGQLANKLSGNHIVIGADNDDRAAVVGAARMDEIVQELGRFAIKPDALFVDYDVVKNNGHALVTEDSVIFPGPLGYTVDRDWHDTETGDRAVSVPDILKNVSTQDGLNLLSGDYRPRRKTPVEARRFARLAAFMGVTICAGLAWSFAQTRAVNLHAQSLRTEAATLYTQYTGEPAPRNPARAVTRALREGTPRDGQFLRLSDIAFRALENIDDVYIESLQYEQQNPQLTLRLVYPRFESASDVERAVTALGGTFTAGGVREQGGRLMGDGVVTMEVPQ